jgi:hypothetical protein
MKLVRRKTRGNKIRKIMRKKRRNIIRVMLKGKEIHIETNNILERPILYAAFFTVVRVS